MTLKDILEGIEIQKISGTIDIEIRGITYDSRKVSKDYMFVAIKGFKTDGHNYIADAIKNGATAIIVEDDVKIDNPEIGRASCRERV